MEEKMSTRCGSVAMREVGQQGEKVSREQTRDLWHNANDRNERGV